jgi:hypothetical protein
VERYNNIPHHALKLGKTTYSPKEVEQDPELEGIFIRRNVHRNDPFNETGQIARQAAAGLFKYTRGNILLVHVDYKATRTRLNVDKRRRDFNFIAEFLQYEHGNVRVNLISHLPPRSLPKKEMVLPIYNTKFLADSIDDVPDVYFRFLVNV